MNRFTINELQKGAHIHFIGIGGISMSGLAELMLNEGFCVSGSDRNRSEITDKLEKLGAKVYIGHDSKNVHDADIAVYTAAVHEDNPEMAEAERLGIRKIDRAEFLGAIMKQYKNAVGVSGTHGKTTTTSMLAHAFIHADKDPTVSLGGELDIIGGNMRVGKSDYFLTESCEYTNSFLKLFPHVAVITNIEEDHLDFFKDIDDIINSFRRFALISKEHGYVVAAGNDANIKKALDGTDCNIIYYGIGSENDIYAENISYRAGFPEFDVMKKGEKLCRIALNVPGEHNILNALATVAVCVIYGIEPQIAARGVEKFKGTHRRFEKLGEINGAAVIADYAHHPTEIKATLDTAKKFKPQKLWCVFQPHTYSRTRSLWDGFLECFKDADEVILTDIYAAREEPDGITTSKKLCGELKQFKNASYMQTFEEIAEYLKKSVKKDDMVFILGAGDIINISEMLF